MIGAFRERVMLQSKVRTRVATGYTEVWSDVAEYWVAVIPADARTRAQYAQLKSEISHTVLFHETVTLSIGTHRLVWVTRGDRFLKLTEPASDPSMVQALTRVAVQEVAAWPSV